MIEYPVIGNAVIFFFIVSLIGLAIYRSTKKRSRRERAKVSIYTCGEDLNPEDLNIPPETFYEYLIGMFKLRKLRDLHSGSLNDYLLWLFAGMVIIIVILLVIV
jgi:hypothetical protein